MKQSISIAVLMLLMTSVLIAQTVSNRTEKFEISTKRSLTSSVPIVHWLNPVPDVTYSAEQRVRIKITVEAATPIKSVQLSVKDAPESKPRASMTITPSEGEKLYTVIEKGLVLIDGENYIEIVAENAEGVKTKTSRRIRVGAMMLADANKLERTDYALVFATDQYDNWNDLVNPVFDSRAIAEELRTQYGFQVDFVENPSQNDVLNKLREYGEKKYKQLDQLLIFFAGHGTYDQTFGEGFVVTRESLVDDPGKTTYLSYNRLRSILNNIQCEHIFLVMDVCFGGTFDEDLASSRGMDDEVYKEQNNNEFIARKLTPKTRRYLTSGGKTYVSDGIPGKNSPFARNFIAALQSQGGKDGILTVTEVFSYVEKLKTPPRLGVFGDNMPGSDFIFIKK